MQTCDSFTTAQLSFARSGHAVASIGGLIYAVGGENDSLIYDTVECYDPALNSWSLVAPLTAPRVACGVCVVEDFMFVIGGWVGSEIAENIERYDPDLDRWDIVGKVETKRFHLGVAEMEGLIYAAGKFQASSALCLHLSKNILEIKKKCFWVVNSTCISMVCPTEKF